MSQSPKHVFHAYVGTIETVDWDTSNSCDRVFEAGNSVTLKKGPPAWSKESFTYRPTIGGTFYIAGAKVRNNLGEEDSLSREELLGALGGFRGVGAVLWQHNKGIGPVGTVEAAWVDDRDHLVGKIKLYAENVSLSAASLRQCIADGSTRSFSLSWYRDPVTKKVTINEVTACTIPKVPGCVMEGVIEAAEGDQPSWQELRRLADERERLSNILVP